MDAQDNDLGSLCFECILQDVVGLPYILLRTAPDIRGNAVTPVEFNRREVLIDFTVAEEDDFVRLFGIVILSDHRTFDDTGLILGHEETLQARKYEHCRYHTCCYSQDLLQHYLTVPAV